MFASGSVDEEQFGPILPVPKYASTDEVIERANATTYGLGASVWSSNTDRAHDVAAQPEAGTVWVNTHLDMAPHIPFGGAMNSGLGNRIRQGRSGQIHPASGHQHGALRNMGIR
jgi:acyl-CoA reductase-like NAD-dependent aldehyde dehydrogenase